MARLIALSGTPGTGKSSVAKLLEGPWDCREVGELALQLGAGTRSHGEVRVDLDRLGRRILKLRRARPTILVGHLAHLLPVSAVIVLRCHPKELLRRLRRSHPRESARRRWDNYLCEAVDLVLAEARGKPIPIWEFDTTGRAPAAVARDVRRTLERRPRSRFGIVNWLSDPTVTKHLLAPPR